MTIGDIEKADDRLGILKGLIEKINDVDVRSQMFLCIQAIEPVVNGVAKLVEGVDLSKALLASINALP